MAGRAGKRWRPWAVSGILPLVRMKRKRGSGRKKRGIRRMR
jgi:hypothetical protein